jgi:hypothetical protein
MLICPKEMEMKTRINSKLKNLESIPMNLMTSK